MVDELLAVRGILATHLVLCWTQQGSLQQDISADIELPELPAGGKMAAWGIAGTAIVLLASSAFDIQLGLPTFLAGAATALLVLLRSQCSILSAALACLAFKQTTASPLPRSSCTSQGVVGPVSILASSPACLLTIRSICLGSAAHWPRHTLRPVS